MFENIFTTRQEQNPEIDAEKIRTDLVEKENAILKEGTDLLEEAKPEVFKNKAANFFLALSLFIGASTAFAGEQNNDKDLPAMGEEQVSQAREKSEAKNQTADFDWQKIATKIEISIGATKEDVKEFQPEAVSSSWYGEINYGVTGQDSKFYTGVTTEDAFNAYYVASGAINYSQNSAEFFNNIHDFSQKGSGLSDKQKVAAMQFFGFYLDKTFNKDMFTSNTHVQVSRDSMFSALKDSYYAYGETTVTSGICGNIHTFLTMTAESMGIEAWLQSGSVPGGAHIWSGMIIGSGEEKQIVFLDYGTLIPTGTLNYKDALGIAERYHQSASVFTSFVGNETEILFPVKSRAQEIIEKAGGVEGAENKLERNLEIGEVEKGDTGVEINISPEVKEIKLTSDNFGLIFFDFKDSSNNPYQSIEDMNAWRVHANVKGENLGVEADATVLHMNIKDIYGGSVSTEAIITRLAGEYIDKEQLTKGEYGEFLLNFGATLEGALKIPVEGGALKSASTEGGFGARLVYLDPNNIGKFFIGASEVLRGQTSDSQNQKTIVKEATKNFIVGGAIKVFEGNVINMEVGKKDLDWGENLSFKGGIEGETLKGNVGYEKSSSDYERFIPSSEKIEVGVTYKGGPKWLVEVIGAKTTEKYKDAQSNDVYNAEVKLKMFLW